MSLVAALLVVAEAQGADVVFYLGLPVAVAEQRAAAVLGQPLDTLEVTTVEAWAAGRLPAVVGDATLERCAGPPTDGAAVARLAEQAETQLLYLDYAGVHAAYAEARAVRLCQRGVDDPLIAARLAFLDGVASHDQGKVDAAGESFAMAHRLARGVPWDPDFPPAGKVLYDLVGHAVAAEPAAALRIAPFAPEAEVWIDGRREDIRGRDRLVEVPVAPGEHLLQLVGPETTSTVRVVVRGAAATLVLPDQLDNRAATWAADGARAPQLEVSVGAYLPVGAPITVLLPEETWRKEPGRPWVCIARHAPTLTRRSITNAVVAGAGAVVALGGSALGVASYIQANEAVSRGEVATTWDQYTVQARNYSQARTRLYVGEGVAALGAIAFGVGLTVPLGPAPGAP